MLFAEGEAGWVAAGFTGLVALVSAAYAGYLALRKHKAEAETERLKLLFGQYEGIVNRVEKEHNEDREKVAKMQDDYISCKEECATMKERVATVEKNNEELRAEVARLRKALEAKPK